MRPRALLLCVSLTATAALTAIACEPATSDPPATPQDAGSTPNPNPTQDAAIRPPGTDASTTPEDAGEPIPAQCPPPAALTPADVPAGYLAAEVVAYRSTTDGDTARFIFDAQGQQIIRLLYVNTEESHGSETTAFGEATEDEVRAWNASAGQIVVVVREERNNPGQPDLDPYDRWLGLVFLDNELLETRLIREGLSAYYTKFGCAPEPLHSAFVYAESEARENRRGIWREGHPTNYEPILEDWIPSNDCRPNPFVEPYCP